MGSHCEAFAGADEGMCVRGYNGQSPAPPASLVVCLPTCIMVGCIWFKGCIGPFDQYFPVLAVCMGIWSSWSPLLWSHMPCLIQKCSVMAALAGLMAIWERVLAPLPPEGVNLGLHRFYSQQHGMVGHATDAP